ncbi:MAG: hypothetical protein E7537_02555 [Ruminococcaceae bacterium]|nr:hypothetical protein [Oscillospiraceae bacterium]
MEEKILFEVKTHKFLPFIKITLVLFVAILVAYYVKELYDCSHFYDDHIHDSSCVGKVDEIDDLIFTEKDYETKRDEYSTFSEYIEGEYKKNKYKYISSIGNIENNMIYTNCEVLEYGSISSANRSFFLGHYDEWAFQWIIWGSIILALLIILSIATIQKCNYIVTENTIKGKKGIKKFDISFSEIIEITKKGKVIIIKTEKKKLKLSTLKNSDEIYNYIKPFVPEIKIVQQPTNVETNTNTVDDIKLF